MKKTIYEPKSKIQKIFKKTINDFIRSEQESLIDDSIREVGEITKFAVKWSIDTVNQFPFCFHDNKSVSVDCTLYDVLVNGQADYGAYKEVNILINEAIEKHGYYLEYEGQGTFIFQKS